MIGSYPIIDAHCHIYPEKIAPRAVAAIGDFYQTPGVGDGTAAGLLRDGGAAGIDHFIVQSVATTPKQVNSINEFIAGAVAQGRGRLTGLGTLHPDSPTIAADIAHLQTLGLKGVKLHPDIQGFKIDDYRCLKIYELCEQEGLPILMHTGDSRYDFSNPNRLLPVLRIYTGLTVIGAHLGGWSVWDEAAESLAGLPNLYVDCSSCRAFMPPKKMRELIRRHGAHRVLFGTDFPLFLPSVELPAFLGLGLTEEENHRILWDNAAELFGIT